MQPKPAAAAPRLTSRPKATSFKCSAGSNRQDSMLEKLIGLTAAEDVLFDTIVRELQANYDYFKSRTYDIVLKPINKIQFEIEKVIWRNGPNKNTPPHSEYRRKKVWFCFI